MKHKITMKASRKNMLSMLQGDDFNFNRRLNNMTNEELLKLGDKEGYWIYSPSAEEVKE